MEMGITRLLFFIGVLVALLGAVFTQVANFPNIWVIVAIIGVIIGLTNIRKKETVSFLVSVLVLSMSTVFLKSLPFVGGFLETLVTNLMSLFVPMAFTVGIITAWKIAKNR